jgi:hypothetical protein
MEQTFLRIVALSTTVSNPHELFTSCDELSQKLLSFVSARPELAWYVGEVRAPSFPHVPPVKFVYRRLEDVLKTLVKVLPLRWGFWGHETTTSGERIYAHPCGALFSKLYVSSFLEQAFGRSHYSFGRIKHT